MVSDPNPYRSPGPAQGESARTRKGVKHPFGIIVVIPFWIVGAVVAVRGELRARSIQEQREAILATYPDQIPAIREQLESTGLSAEAREKLEYELHYREGGVVRGMHRWTAYNARSSGYASGIALFLVGLAILGYCYQPNKKRDDVATKESKVPK